MAYDPRKAVEKQVRRAQESTQDYASGVRESKRPIISRAKSRKGKMKNKWNAAIDNGKWDAGLDAWTDDAIRERGATVGANNYAQGVKDAESKSLAFHEEFASFMNGHQAAMDAMPDETEEQRYAKMNANARGIAKFKRSRKRR